MKMSVDAELLSTATLQQYQDGLVIAAGNIGALLSQVEFAVNGNSVIPKEFRQLYLSTLGRVSLLAEDLVNRLSEESDEARQSPDSPQLMTDNIDTVLPEPEISHSPGNEVTTIMSDQEVKTPIEPEKAFESHVPVNGRSIERFSDALLEQFSQSRRAEYTFDRAMKVVIKDDKSFTLNGERQTLRVHQNGDPSVTIQVLNALLEASIVGQQPGMSVREIELAIQNPNAKTDNIQVTLQRYKRMGLVITVGRSKQTETIYGFPKYVEIKDKRPEPKERTDFLDRTPAATNGSRVA